MGTISKDTKLSATGQLGPRVTTERTVNAFNATATNISGTATNLHVALAELEADLKRDLEGKKEYEDYAKTLNIKKKDLEKRIEENQRWIDNFEQNDTAGAFEAQYKKLLDQIQIIYSSAKDFHGKGIDMLIKEFNYHLAYKRWNDTFTAIPFKPK
uniref:Uncharacterized protein n=1 Tax=Chlamydomonas leiostraca TaxID=1034604 RepID=A0A7S0X0T4_9CHLO|mmetsp:Transcript_7551/g.18729  ORF Transcript_7551/g.18729 Transcript_7551/m.18729 type:complete len:156 (+) Transcript_7551:113-580(+)|eukprot:CAMPEP_0202870332 /NCGR_PEP_ID=MMETSP1391-20130828/15384_1 /ASSEMBLY_ACC=CAM_ASM_000867 /TAXON_ID=1034604 /ORGANISM="Chlamydomonas leiostraca, Strain SAG 11-49" /LENGTH=155 /DNA_ID=CAMNT_0049550869 /DNA_START=64 /DNA_END=531 /DNA_ORIENTATION=+